MKTPSANPNKIGSTKIKPPTLEEMASKATIGRREPPAPDDPKNRWWVLGRSILLGAIVVVAVFILIWLMTTMGSYTLAPQA